LTMWLLVLFIAVPLIEIALFIQVGGWLTLWPTLAIVVATAILGTWLVRQQGVTVLRDLQSSLEQARDPLAPLAHGAMILLAGALLLTPGFLTDAIGFILLFPAFRSALLRWIIRHNAHRVVFRTGPQGSRPHGSGRSSRDDDVIDAEFRDVTQPDDDRRQERDRIGQQQDAAAGRNHDGSGRTRH